jgi:hypothetical protein
LKPHTIRNSLLLVGRKTAGVESNAVDGIDGILIPSFETARSTLLLGERGKTQSP